MECQLTRLVMELPIDIDYVIRRADLRRQGVYGAATLVVALRQAGFDADLVKRTARQTVFSSLTHRVQYVKEQERFAIRFGPERILISLKLDRNWQQILEQFHQYVSDSCFNNGGVGSIVKSDYIEAEEALSLQRMEPLLDYKLLPKVAGLLLDARRQSKVAPRKSKWKMKEGMKERVGVSEKGFPKIPCLSSACFESLAPDFGDSQPELFSAWVNKLGSEDGQFVVTSRPFVMIGDADLPTLIEGYSLGVLCQFTGAQLFLESFDHIHSLASRSVLSPPARFFLGPASVLSVDEDAPPVVCGSGSEWSAELRRFALGQTAKIHGVSEPVKVSPRAKF